MVMDYSRLEASIRDEERSISTNLFDLHELVQRIGNNAEPHDVPPAYGFEEGPPSYEAQLTDHNTRRWTLRQEDTGFQRLISTSSSSSSPPSLSITTRMKPRFFSSRPDIELRIALPPRCFRPDEPRTACVDFDDGGKQQLPWRPRANITLSQSTGLATHRVEMTCTDLVHWRFDYEGEEYAWGLVQSPKFALVLKCIGSTKEVARWVYSEFGSLAAQGQDAGTLRINAGAEDYDERMDLIIQATCMVTVAYWKKMGRLYRNKRTIDQSLVVGLRGARMGMSSQRRDGIVA